MVSAACRKSVACRVLTFCFFVLPTLPADGMIEVCAIGGVAHMGRLAVGLARAQRLAQGRSVCVTTKEQLPMQVDGEPWLQEPCRLQVSHKSQVSESANIFPGPYSHYIQSLPSHHHCVC